MISAEQRDRLFQSAPGATDCPVAPLGSRWVKVAEFRVLGTPKAQPRPRAFARRFGNKFSARVYDPGTAEGWKGDIALAARPHLPPTAIEGPVKVDAVFLFPRPKCLLRKKDPETRIRHTAKPDRDNLDKSLLDCLKTLGFFVDDSQVCDGSATKFYAAKGEQSGAEITIYKLAQVIGDYAVDVKIERKEGGK